MTKTSKTIKKKQNYKRKIIYSLTATVLIAQMAIIYFGWQRISYLDSAVNQSARNDIREMIFAATDGLKHPAPVDERTGDTYFPEARYYLPNSHDKQLLYRYSNFDGVEEVTVTTKQLIAGMKVKLYEGTKLEEMLNNVPLLMSCERGYRLTFEPITKENLGDTLLLVQEVQLENNKTVYAYREKGCVALDEEQNKIDFSKLRVY